MSLILQGDLIVTNAAADMITIISDWQLAASRTSGIMDVFRAVFWGNQRNEDLESNLFCGLRNCRPVDSRLGAFDRTRVSGYVDAHLLRARACPEGAKSCNSAARADRKEPSYREFRVLAEGARGIPGAVFGLPWR